MHWRPLCYKVFFTVFFPKALLLPQGSCERHFSETFSACRTFLPLIRSFCHSKYKSGNMFNWSWDPVLSSYPHQLHHKLYGVAVLSSVHSNAASVKDKHKTQILKSPERLHASTELPPHDRERTWAVKSYWFWCFKHISDCSSQVRDQSTLQWKTEEGWKFDLRLAKFLTFVRVNPLFLSLSQSCFSCTDLITTNHLIWFYWDMLHK